MVLPGALLEVGVSRVEAEVGGFDNLDVVGVTLSSMW